MPKNKTQFLRLYGYPRGQRSAANTHNSVIAEGLRTQTHISHLDKSPHIQVFNNPESPVENPLELGKWIEEKMVQCRYGSSERYPKGRPMRKNAVALGTLITSLPQRTVETPQEVVSKFRELSQSWLKGWLEERDMLLHTCILHLDEEYPHIHIWFTPSLELIEKGQWPLGQTTFPQRAVLRDLQVRFFENVGQHFSQSQLIKNIPKKLKKLDRRTATILRDLPDKLTNNPIFDIGFFNFILAFARIARTKNTEDRAATMDLIKEVLDIETSQSNKGIILALIDENDKLGI